MAILPSPWSLGVVLLGAGASSRMGKPKLLLPWGDTTVIGHLVALWQKLRATQITVVMAAGDAAMDNELDRIRFPAPNRIINANPQKGMFSSIQCAAAWDRWETQLTHWAIALGDQPHLKPQTLISLLEFSQSHRERICQPARGARPRHPVILPKDRFLMLSTSHHPNLKEFLESVGADVRTIEINDPALDLDIDRPSDYEQALGLQGGSI